MKAIQGLLRMLFPQRCVICKSTHISGNGDDAALAVCADCYSHLPFNHHCCHQCALPLPADSSDQSLCGNCLKQTPAFDYSISVFRYEADIVRLVHGLKYHGRLVYGRALGILLAQAWHAHGKCWQAPENRPDCLLPVPLHAGRLRRRGYNQSVEIARELAAGGFRESPLPVDTCSVIRCRATSSQAGLNLAGRRSNIKGAFQLRRAISYRHVVLIDDVVTTGSTVNELARLLKAAGVASVGVLSLARVESHG